MDQDFNKFKDLIKLMESAPQMQAPERLTGRIMARLALEEKNGLRLKFKQAILKIWIGRQNFGISSPRDCSYCFFMTGFFYLVIGLILIVGFKSVIARLPVMGWISLQPYFILGTATLMIVLGGILITNNRTALKMARIGTFIYIICTVANGILISPNLNVPYAGIFLTGFIVAGIIIGSILAFAVHIIEFQNDFITQGMI